MSKPNEPRDLRPDTRIVTGGRTPHEYHGFVNPPVYHASTLLYPSAADMVAHRARYQYGRRGTPTSEALEDALRALEGPNCAGVSPMGSRPAAVMRSSKALSFSTATTSRCKRSTVARGVLAGATIPFQLVAS